MSITKKFIRLPGELGGTKLAVYSSGKKFAPVVLLCHGWGSNSFIYKNLMKNLTGYRTVAFDFPGFGHSEPQTPEETSLDRYGKIIIYLADKYSAKDDIFGIVSFSMSAAIVGRLLEEGKIRAKKIILCGLIFNGIGDGDILNRFEIIDKAFIVWYRGLKSLPRKLRATVAKFDAPGILRSKRITPKYVEKYEFIDFGSALVIAKELEEIIVRPLNLPEGCDALLINGQKDRFNKPEQILKFADSCDRKTNAVILDGLNHEVMVDDSRLFDHTVKTFLEE